jgi:hypothetical protein
MSDVITFKPRAHLEAEQQVKEYIAFAKKLRGFDKENASLDWGAVNWSFWIKSLAFSKLGTNVRSKSFGPDDVLEPQIIDFAKAYCVHQQTLNRTDEVIQVVAVRLVEKALLDLGYVADITLVDGGVMDRAAEICDDRSVHESEDRAYRCGQQLQALSKFLDDNNLTVRLVHWTNPIPRPNDAEGHRKREDDRKKKMPDPGVLNALAEIWVANPQEHRDIFATSNSVILLSAPGRVDELNKLAKDCVIWKENTKGEKELFLNWYGQKGFGFSDKPVPKTFQPFCLEAIERIKAITEGPRRLARLLEENPDKFPIHDECPRVSQDEILTHEHILAAMCLEGTQGTPRNSVKIWLDQTLKILDKRNDCKASAAILREALEGMYAGKLSPGKRDRITLTLRKLNVFIREYWLPSTFPFTTESKTVKYQHALNCYYSYQFEKRFKAKLFSIEAQDNNKLNSALTPAAGARNKGLNIFERWGYEGKGFGLTTHQFRHYLNTLAAKGNVGEVEIARWSSRLDLSQNKVYNHETTQERLDRVLSVGMGSQNKNLAELSAKNEPISLKDLGGSEDRIAHTTLFGKCEHDFVVEPCPKFRGCLSCSKHKCIKGDDEKLRRIKFEKEALKVNLETAQKGVDEGFFGADKWLQDTMQNYERACELVNILVDPEVPDGSVIACRDDGFTEVTKALAARGKLEISGDQLPALEKAKPGFDKDKLRKLLGR